jgi:hypothetical protein
MKRVLIVMTVAAIGAVLLPSAASAAPTLAYDSIPKTLPGNVPSQAFQATQTGEFGDGVRLEPGTPRSLQSVRVTLSSWGCQSGTWNGGDCLTTAGATFAHSITLTIYAMGAGGAVGAEVAHKTQTFNIRYRPSANNVKCTDDDAGKWFKKADGTCYNGFAQSIKFGFAGELIPVDREVIWTVAFNTSGYGDNPLGYSTACSGTNEGCPYDSLNVGLNTSSHAPYIGTDVQPAGAYHDSKTAGQYCDGGTLGTGVLRLDDNCWGGYVPMAEIMTKRAA